MNKATKTVIGFLVAIFVLAAGIFGIVAHDSKHAPEQAAGATATLDAVDNPYVSIGGVKTYNYNQQIAATSSVFCSIKNPFGATSTVSSYSVNGLTNGLGTQTFDLSTSSTAIGSSSPAFLRAYSTGTGAFPALWTPEGTTTNANVIGMSAKNTGQSDIILGPTDYLNARIATGTPNVFVNYITGTCTGVIRKL